MGLSVWKNGQEKAVHSVVQGVDTIVVAPTGGGNTFMALVADLALMDGAKKGTTIIVAPTIAACGNY